MQLTTKRSNLFGITGNRYSCVGAFYPVQLAPSMGHQQRTTPWFNDEIQHVSGW